MSRQSYQEDVQLLVWLVSQRVISLHDLRAGNDCCYDAFIAYGGNEQYSGALFAQCRNAALEELGEVGDIPAIWFDPEW